MSLLTATHTNDSSTRGCSVDGCDRPHKGHGLCNRHWLRWRRNGSPHIARPRGGHNKGQPHGPYATTAGRLEDLRWMLDTGESPAMACHRLGLNANSLARWLTRQGEHELARIFYGLDKQQVAA